MKNFSKQFGAKVTSDLTERYAQSPNWKDGKFQNLEETGMSISFWDIPKLLYKQFTDKARREPQQPIPVVPFEKTRFLDANNGTQFIWYGHSVILMRMNGQTILIDPMLGDNASPIAPSKTKRFSENTLNIISDLPEIDLMLLSHDHYDHLDFDSIQLLKGKTKRYLVALGVKRHLVHWGIDGDLITELDWWDSNTFSNIDITFTPSRHFSGRGLKDRAKSLWGGWVFKTEDDNIWFSGDGGYGAHFKEVGKRLGPFDFGFMECGQYNEKWHQIHMFPHESVQAAIDAQVNTVMPVHWAGFALSQHNWEEPAELFADSATDKGLSTVFPLIGELMTVNKANVDERWWLKQLTRDQRDK